MTKSLWNTISNKASLTVLEKLLNEKKVLSIYDLPSKYTLSQYRYIIEELEKKLVLFSSRKNRRLYYRINPYFQERIKNLIHTHTDFDQNILEEQPIFNILSDFDDWALNKESALLHLVPILYLTNGKTTICVRNRREKQKILNYIPSDLVEITINPSYFINKKIQWIKDLPVLSPEILIMELLKNHNYRIRLASLFLLPFIPPQQLASRIQKTNPNSSTVLYLIIALNEYFKENSSNTVLDQWFFNFDQYSKFTELNYYWSNTRPKKSKVKGYFQSLYSEYQKTHNTFSKWELLSQFYQENSTTFTPQAFNSLIGA